VERPPAIYGLTSGLRLRVIVTVGDGYWAVLTAPPVPSRKTPNQRDEGDPQEGGGEAQRRRSPLRGDLPMRPLHRRQGAKASIRRGVVDQFARPFATSMAGRSTYTDKGTARAAFARRQYHHPDELRKTPRGLRAGRPPPRGLPPRSRPTPDATSAVCQTSTFAPSESRPGGKFARGARQVTAYTVPAPLRAATNRISLQNCSRRQMCRSDDQSEAGFE